MQTITLDEHRITQPCVATIGGFDGVHLGHQWLLAQIRQEADRRKWSALAITFTTPPRKVLHPEKHLDRLSTTEEKMQLFEKAHMDYAALLPFIDSIRMLSAYDFMKEILYKQWGVRALVIGYDHRFGHNRAEGFDDYVRYGLQLGIDVLPAEAFMMNDEAISSSRIRNLLFDGEVEKANAMLGYTYPLTGRVVSGYQIGRRIGFPTANLSPCDRDKLIPADGVYAVNVLIDGIQHRGMLNIGRRPTIDEGHERSIEVHVLSFEGNLYNKELTLHFLKRIREEQRFDSLEALQEQLENDRREIESLTL